MGVVVSCLRAIGNCLTSIVNAIGGVIMAIVSGIGAIFKSIISCLTCGGGSRSSRATGGRMGGTSHRRRGFGRKRPMMSTV